jgi:fimbrial chaperone protein
MPSRRRLLAAVVTALVVAAAGAAHARGQLQTRQTGVLIAAGERAGRLVLANTGDAPVAAQVRLYAWVQDGHEDVLTPSTALVASPAIVEIPADSEQLVRLVRPSSAAPEQELAYRAVVDELPGPPGDEAEAAVAVRMRYLLPVFVRTADAGPAQVHCGIEAQRLVCRNSGGRAAQLAAASLVGAAGRRIELTDGLLGYVLAGSTRRWPLEAADLVALGAPQTLEVRLNGEPVQLELDVAR